MLLPWKVQTGRLLEEIGKNPEAAVLRQPLRIFADLLAQVGARCAEIDDPVLNGLMCQLAIYGVADPDDSGFDQAKTERLIADKERITREHRHPAIYITIQDAESEED